VRRSIPALRQRNRRPAGRGLQRWLVALLVLLLASSGFPHGLMADHAGHAAGMPHEFVAASQGLDGNPCCAEHDGDRQTRICSAASGCGMCAPPAAPAVRVLLENDSALALPEATPPGRSLTPNRRPPKTLSNV
jgi:hypothetical protein